MEVPGSPPRISQGRISRCLHGFLRGSQGVNGAFRGVRWVPRFSSFCIARLTMFSLVPMCAALFCTLSESRTYSWMKALTIKVLNCSRSSPEFLQGGPPTYPGVGRVGSPWNPLSCLPFSEPPAFLKKHGNIFESWKSIKNQYESMK